MSSGLFLLAKYDHHSADGETAWQGEAADLWSELLRACCEPGLALEHRCTSCGVTPGGYLDPRCSGLRLCLDTGHTC